MEKTTYSTKNQIPYSLLKSSDLEEDQENIWEIQPTEIDSFSGASGNEYYIILTEESVPTRGESSNCALGIFSALAPTTALARFNSKLWIDEFPQCTDIFTEAHYKDNKKDKIEYYSFMAKIDLENEEREAEDIVYNIKEIYNV